MGSFKSLDKMPSDKLPEIAFIGRSNVGKSSIINNLLSAKVAKVSGTPGKTQLINFFKINKTFYTVDLPGYGFAEVTLSIKKEWEEFIDVYLRERTTLKAIVLLLDIRRVPNEHDRMISGWMKALPGVTPIFVLTKLDKVTRNQANKNKIMIAKELFISQHEIFMHSSVNSTGKYEILKKIDDIISAGKNIKIDNEEYIDESTDL